MKKLVGLLALALSTSFAAQAIHAQEPVQAPAASTSDVRLSMEVLSDTSGADLSPYLKALASDLKKHWALAAGKAGAGKSKVALVTLTIAHDGSLAAAHLSGGGKEDAAFDRAAWGAVTGTSMSPLPVGLKDSALKLRVRFDTN